MKGSIGTSMILLRRKPSNGHKSKISPSSQRSKDHKAHLSRMAKLKKRNADLKDRYEERAMMYGFDK